MKNVNIYNNAIRFTYPDKTSTDVEIQSFPVEPSSSHHSIPRNHEDYQALVDAGEDQTWIVGRLTTMLGHKHQSSQCVMLQ